jgi:heme-degrading monooxygenase HmoA
MIKIMIKRKAPREKEAELMKLITELRTAAMQQAGYISGETLHGTEKPEEYLVISIWDSDYFWKKWIATDERKEIQGKIDKLLGGSTEYEIYQYPKKTMTP